MGSSYLPPPEQNVVNVGDEISASTLAGLQYASPGGSEANPFATVSYVTTALSGITPPSLTGYAQLSGATFTGKASFTTTTAGAINFQPGVTPSSPANGDVWMGQNTLFIRGIDGQNRAMATLQATQIFTSPQVIDTTNNTSPALRITQKGLGYAIRIEDESTPDTSATIVDHLGNVGIRVNPGSQSLLDGLTVHGHVAITPESGGCLFFSNGNYLYDMVEGGANPFTHGSFNHNDYPVELEINVNGIQYRLPARQFNAP